MTSRTTLPARIDPVMLPGVAMLSDEQQRIFGEALVLYQEWYATPPSRRRNVVLRASAQLRRSRRGIAKLFTMLAETQDYRLLLPKPRRDKGAPRAWDHLAIEYLKSRFVTLRSKQKAYEDTARVCQATGWQCGSYRSACAHLRSYERSGEGQAAVTMNHKEKDYQDQCELPILRDRTTLQPMELICGDHHQFDVIVMWPDGQMVRPWLSAWIDVRTGLWLGLTVCKSPDAKSIADSLYATIKRLGVPQNVYIDNGKAYRAKILRGEKFEGDEIGRIDLEPQVQNTLAALQQGLYGDSRQVHALPFNARAKIVERYFGIGGFSDWCKTLPGYTGRRYDNMPDKTRKLVKARRVMHLSDFLFAFMKEVKRMNMRPSRGAGMGGRSPVEVMDWFVRNGWKPHRVLDERLLDIMAGRKTERIVGRLGIQHFGTVGDPLYYYDERLRAIQGKKVTVIWSDADMVVRKSWADNEEGARYRAVPSKLMVYHEGQFICEALPVERTRYLDDPEVEGKLREQRRKRKAVRDDIQSMNQFAEYVDINPEDAAELESIEEPKKLKLVKTDNRSDFDRMLEQARKKRSYLDILDKDSTHSHDTEE